MPVVLIDRERPASADAVVVDHRSGIRQVAEALIALGHRRIALLTGSTALYPSRERIAAYKAALTAAAIPFVPHLLRTGSFQADFGMTQTLLLLDERPAPTAIIAGGIVMLPGVVRALRQRRVAIPRDMSLIAAGDSDVADLLQPAIAVVRWDYAEMGRLAAGLALERIRGGRPSEPRRIVVPSDIVPRDSLAAPR